MNSFKQYSGVLELEKAIKTLGRTPLNVEIIEKTSFSSGSVSEIMKGKREPSKRFVEEFTRGFGILKENNNSQNEIKKPQSDESGLKDKLIAILESSIKRVEADLNRVLEENERLRNSKAN